MQHDIPLFEVSFEVCNKVGGINTVVKSKLSYAIKHFKNYFCLGPYTFKNEEFVEKDIPKKFIDASESLKQKGIIIHYGLWNYADVSANVILVEYMGYSSHINEIKSDIWDIGKVDSLNSDWYDFDEVMLWSWCCGIVISELSKNFDSKVLVHAHEWMSGGCIFYLKKVKSLQFRTIFTTHATMLGRSICGHGENLYDLIETIDVDDFAKKMGVSIKQQTEKALANISDCFTTVSDLTGNEAEHFYMKKPDFILYNGFDNNNFHALKNIELFFKYSQNKLKYALYNVFSPFYEFDINKCKIYYTSGRNELRDKGFDIYIRALGRLNELLKKNKSDKKVINLFLVSMGNFPVLKNPYAVPLSTHDVGMSNEYIELMFKCGLLNGPYDNVKVLLVPNMLNGLDGYFNMDYYDVVSGTDLGIFPSFYEPWGYTPLESINYAVPCVTTNLSGFGQYIYDNFSSNESVQILNRKNVDDEFVIDELVDIMFFNLNKDSKKNIEFKENARKFSKNFTWDKFYENYLNAYDYVLKK